MKKLIQNVIGGFAGAVALNILHETVRRFDADAPRIDLIGEESLNKTIEAAGGKQLEGGSLYGATLAGDVVSNTLYYSVIGAGKHKNLILRGTLVGITAGLGALQFTRPIGLDDTPVNRTRKTKIMTVGYYLAGGLVAACVIGALRGKDSNMI
jgi:hypothetical protein